MQKGFLCCNVIWAAMGLCKSKNCKSNVKVTDFVLFGMIFWYIEHTGPRLNIKTVLSTYGDFHVKDKTAVRTTPVKLVSGECRKIPLMISRHGFSLWLGAVRRQPITWANVDPNLCWNMGSLDHNEIILWFVSCVSGKYRMLVSNYVLWQQYCKSMCIISLVSFM